jgi:RalA-binding protein 1
MVNQCQVARQPSYGRDIDDKAYRHAFMLIETKKNGNITRHVLCAESDEERDSWVEYLVRYAANASEDAAEASRGKLRKLSKGDVGSIATERTASHSADSSTTDLADKVVSSSTLTPVEEQSETKPPMMKSATAPVSSNGEAGIAHPPAAPVQQNYRTEEVSAPPNPTLTRASVLAPREMGGKRNSREQQTSTTSTQAPKKKGFWGRMFHSGGKCMLSFARSIKLNLCFRFESSSYQSTCIWRTTGTCY